MTAKFKISILSIVVLLGYASTSNAVNQCGNEYSSGNPFPCLNGGNCTWWASKQAVNNWGVSWSQLPSTRSAMYWDDDAKGKANYTVSTVPSANTIGVKNSSPYSCTVNGKKTTCDYGHVAWIESVSNGQVTYTEMNYGYWGVNRKTKPASFFNAYISKGASASSYDGKNPNTTGCDKDAITVASTSIVSVAKKNLGLVELRWSNTCKTNWTRVKPNSTSAATTATIVRSSDSKKYYYSGTGAVFSPMVSSANIKSCATGVISGVASVGACK